MLRILNYLSVEENKILSEIEDYVRQKLATDVTGHGFDHIKRTVLLTERIALTEPQADLFTCLVGAYLHDVIDDKVVANVREAKQELRAFLTEVGLTETRITAVFLIIENISYKASLDAKTPELTIEAKAVQDADRIEAIGAIGIGRTFYYGGLKGHAIYNAAIPPRQVSELTSENYRTNEGTVIDHFYEKLILLYDQLHTEKGREIAQPRHEFLLQFIEEFKLEWENEKQ